MATKMKLRLGVADDPTQLQPSLSDCLAAVLQQADPLMTDVLQGLEAGTTATGPRRIPAFQLPNVKGAILALQTTSKTVKATFVKELTRLVYEGGGKDQTANEVLRFEDLQLFADEQLDLSIEIARAQQEVALAVDDTLPAVDALVMQAQRTVDDAKREELLRQASKLAMSDFAVIPLHFEITPWAYRKGLSYQPRIDQYTLATEVKRAGS